MELIRLHELEFLLKHLPSIKAAIEATRKHLNVIASEEGIDDEISASMLSARKLINVKPGSSSDRTGETVLKYRASLRREITELRYDLMVLELIREKLQIGLNALFPSQRTIIEKRYFENKTWVEISLDVCLSTAEAQRRRKKAIELMRHICRISVENYQKIIQIIKE